MSILISIALATICFSYDGSEECHPVLLGKNTPTPTGDFVLQKRITATKGYGGDVLQFHETDNYVYAIHRVWLLSPNQKRLERLKSKNISDRYISGGCINVEPEVYKKLLDCCSNSSITIK
jgi:signal peptidase I